MIKIAEVSQIDYARGLVKVRVPDLDNVETNWLSIPDNEYNMPDVNDVVRVSLDDGDYTNGICHGRYYNNGNQPALSGPTVFYKKLAGDLVIKYDSAAKLLEIDAANIHIKGNVSIHGSLTVTGNISATGSITDVGGNTNHHDH